MRGLRRPKKKAIFLAVAVLVLAVSIFIVARYLNSNGTPGTPVNDTGDRGKTLEE